MSAFGFDFYLPASGCGNPNDSTFTAQIGDQTLVFDAAGDTKQQWSTHIGTAVVSAATDNFQLAINADGVTAKDFVIDTSF